MDRQLQEGSAPRVLPLLSVLEYARLLADLDARLSIDERTCTVAESSLLARLRAAVDGMVDDLEKFSAKRCAWEAGSGPVAKATVFGQLDAGELATLFATFRGPRWPGERR